MALVTPKHLERDPWLGIFAYGVVSPSGVSGIFTCPDANHLCVVSRGAGYLVDVTNPRASEMICEQVLGVYPVADLEVLVFVDFTSLMAYGVDGLVWQTERLSWDGLKVHEIRGNRLLGEGWSAPKNRTVGFVVDLRTGMHEGGAYEPIS